MTADDTQDCSLSVDRDGTQDCSLSLEIHVSFAEIVTWENELPTMAQNPYPRLFPIFYNNFPKSAELTV